MLHRSAVCADLVLRYERLLERFVDAPVVAVALHGDTAVGPEHRALLDAVATAAGPTVRDDTTAGLGVTLRALAAQPLTDGTGTVVGAIGVADHSPRRWSRHDLDTLADLADACSDELAERRRSQDAAREAEQAADLARRSRVLLALSEALSATQTLDDVARAVERVVVEQLDCLHGGLWLLVPAAHAGEVDRLHNVREPSGRWASAVRNATLAVATDNPLGEAVLTGGPLLFTTTAEQNARYPELDLSRQVGRTRFFQPLGLEKVLGVLALIWDVERPVSVEDQLTVETLGAYVAQAVRRAQLLTERQAAASTLQQAMLPRLPAAPDLELVARYHPAAAHDSVGGDWYDAVAAPAGTIDLVIGDVAGHDLAAAAVMGEVRNMLRAFSLAHEESPAQTVTRLDESLVAFDVDRFASLLLVRAAPADGSGHRRLRWTSAGHFPPLLLTPDGQVELLADPEGADLLLGVDTALARHDRECVVPEGSLLLLFTDGLVERRHESLGTGLERLRGSALAHREETTEAFLDAVVADLVGTDHEDDVAVLAVRLSGPRRT